MLWVSWMPPVTLSVLTEKALVVSVDVLLMYLAYTLTRRLLDWAWEWWERR